jgi:hypothetical protein
MMVPFQLKIRHAHGLVEFFDLHQDPGLTNIGSHPENDIVLLGANVATFHLLLDHRSMPPYLLVLTNEHPTTLNSAPIYLNQAQPIENCGTLHVAGHTLILSWDVRRFS